MPGYVAGFEITPEGFVYGGHGELVLRAGPGLVGLRAPVRTLEDGRYALMRYGQTFAGVRYGLEVFASIVAGQPVAFVRIELHNDTAHPLQARWAVGMRYSGGALKPDGVRRFRFLRPAEPQRAGLYTQPGSVFDPAWDYTFGNMLVRERDDGLELLSALPGAGCSRAARRSCGARRRSWARSTPA